jgi:hypothetical protein
MWSHAVDLLTTGHWRDRWKQRSSTAEDIARAAARGMTYSPHEWKKRNSHISTAKALEIMGTLDAPEPSDRDNIIREYFISPFVAKSGRGQWKLAVNHMAHDQNANAWSHIFGIEARCFAYDHPGYLG